MGKTKQTKPQMNGGYTEEELQEALSDLKTGKSLRFVSAKYKIPKTTLFYKKKGVTKPTKERRGPKCILGDEEENHLVDWIFYMSDQGIPITKLQLLNSAKIVLKNLGKEVAFKNGLPGRHWYNGFESRHPEVCERLSQNLLYTRATLTEQMIREWFKRVDVQFEKYNVQGIDPSRIFNCGESAFSLSPKGEEVVVRAGHKVACNNENLTVLFCGSAAGQLLPPMILFNYVRIPRSISETMPKGFDIGRTETGRQTAESFYKWVENCFFKWLKANKIQFPVILYVDGHVSLYLTRELSNFCRDNDIVLVALHPNATNILQPMDVAFFHSLKENWTTTIKNWREEHNEKRLQRKYFGGLMKEALDNLNQKEILMSGFRATGLYPFSPDAVKYENFFKKSVEQETTELSYLEYIESQIDAEDLALFKHTGVNGDWTGPDHLEGLYQFWKRIQGKQNADKQNAHVTGDCGSDQASDEEQQNNNDENTEKKAKRKVKRLRMQEEKKEKQLMRKSKKPRLVRKTIKKEILMDDNDFETLVTGAVDEELSVIDLNDNVTDGEDGNRDNSIGEKG